MIVDAAIALFCSQPYNEVSVDDVCNRVGVAHGLVSYHFGGKQGLFAAAVESVWRELVDYQRPREDETTASERIHGYLRRHFEYARRYPERLNLIRAGSSDPDVSELLTTGREEGMREVAASLGCPTQQSPRLRASVSGWVSFVDSVTMEWQENEDLELEFVTDVCVQALITAVRAANGQVHDAETEFRALEQVAGPPRAVGQPPTSRRRGRKTAVSA